MVFAPLQVTIPRTMLAYPNIDPIAFEIGPLAIRWYGLSYVVGILLVWLALHLRARDRRYGWTPDEVSDIVFYIALFGIIGGRLGYVLLYNPAFYLSHPLQIIMVQNGGMSFHGGVLGLAFACWWFGRKTGRRFIEVAEFFVPAGPIGLIFGRTANFINSELWGAPTTMPWGVVFPSPEAGGVPRHPSQLYEAFLEGVVLFVGLWLYSRTPRPAGMITGLFLFGYGCFRFLVEFVREPDAHIGYLAFDWFTMGQALSLPMILIGGAMIIYAQRHSARG